MTAEPSCCVPLADRSPGRDRVYLRRDVLLEKNATSQAKRQIAATAMTMTPTMIAMCHPVRFPSIVPSYRPRGEPQAEIAASGFPSECPEADRQPGVGGGSSHVWHTLTGWVG